jgi:hypothetical protein
MDELRQPDPFHGVFTHRATAEGQVRIDRHPTAKRTLPDPHTGRDLHIATVELSGAICPACERRAEGGFVSFVSDLRLVFACPHCVSLVWINGA